MSLVPPRTTVVSKLITPPGGGSGKSDSISEGDLEYVCDILFRPTAAWTSLSLLFVRCLAK